MIILDKKCLLASTTENNETITVAHYEDGIYLIQAKTVTSPRSLCMVEADKQSDV